METVSFNAFNEQSILNIKHNYSVCCMCVLESLLT